MSPRKVLFLIIIIVLLAIYIDLPRSVPIKLSWNGISIDQTFTKPPIAQLNQEIKQGLDLQGGTQVVLEADMSSIKPEDRVDALESAKEIIARRVDLYGVSEPVIQTSVSENSYRIIVEMPGVKDSSEALALIGQTAQLQFREQQTIDTGNTESTESAQAVVFAPTELTGDDLERARVEFDQQTGKPVISLKFTQEGAEKFAQITERNIGEPIAIYIDEYPVTAPMVNEKITGGSAIITGEFTTDEAKNLAIQLNAGALPVPINVLEQRNVGASLGQESVARSLQAGAVGLAMVMLFMVLYYGKLGLVANFALVIYGLITLAVYKLIPVTITLPGLAGFILSVGMAVDSNILIFERTKEELRAGKKWKSAMELGFGRAWDSIKDANVATLITTFILFNPLNWTFLNTSGLVRGFALTLAIGILVSLFTGIVVTRTLMRVFLTEKVSKAKKSNKTKAVSPAFLKAWRRV